MTVCILLYPSICFLVFKEAEVGELISAGRRSSTAPAEPRDGGRKPPARMHCPAARAPVRRDDPPQAPLTDEALMAGLDAIARALARSHPGRRFIFEPGPRDDLGGLVVGREVWGRLTAPEDPHAPVVDGDGLRSAWAADVANEDAADHRG